MAEKQEKRRKRPRWRRRLVVAALVMLAGLFGLYSVQRWVLHNFHEVVPGEVYRSAQPGPEQLRQWMQRYGIRTVVNLRSDVDRDAVREEIKAAEKLGLKYVSVSLWKLHLPTRDKMRELIDAIEAAERPMLLHCRAGADRSGVAGVMADMAIGGANYDSARKQLSMRYLHFDPYADHVSGVLKVYESYCEGKGIGTGGWQQFRNWALNVYSVSPAQPTTTP